MTLHVALVLQVNLWTSPEDETAMPKSNHHRQARGRQSKIVYRPDMWWQAFRAVPHRFSHSRSMKNNWIKLCPTKIVSKSFIYILLYSIWFRLVHICRIPHSTGVFAKKFSTRVPYFQTNPSQARLSWLEPGWVEFLSWQNVKVGGPKRSEVSGRLM